MNGSIKTSEKNSGSETISCRMCQKPVTEKICTVDDYDFYRCPYCYFIFCPTLDQNYINDLYKSGYHNSENGAPDDGWASIEHLQPALNLLNKSNTSILDFGCGESLIPDKLREKGYRVTGIDVAPPVRKQHNRITGDILEMNLSENTYDFVYSIQVFEHIPEPLPYLVELLRMLKPGGHLFIHTDMETEERFEDGFKNWNYVAPPDHCVFYRNRSFEVFLEGKPYSLIFKDEKKILIKK